MIDVKVTIDVKPLLRFRSELSKALLSSDANAVMSDVFKQWGFVFRSFTQRRFDQYSKGGGDWAPLALSTIIGRARRPVQRVKAMYDAGYIDKETFDKKHERAVKQYKKTVTKIKAGLSTVAILRDTGTLFNALTPSLSGIAGQYQETIPGGIRVGFGGPSRHPEGKATIADIASFHQDGGPHLPKREIIVMPPDDVVAKFAEVLDKGIRRLLRETHNGS